MKIFVINLARRQDRHAAMTAQLKKLGLSFETIAAIDADAVSPAWIANYFTPSGPLGILPKGDQCCSLSHRKAWAAFLASGEPYATILEDDVVLDRAAASLLANTDWLPGAADLVKLEHFGPQSQRVLIGTRTEIGRGRSIAPILSRHTGAAAYILSRRAAQELLKLRRWNVPVDHLLFNPNVSPTAAKLKPLQMLPAIARQESGFGGASDIRPWRIADRRLRPELIRREIVRAYYELRLLPKQIVQVLGGQARLMKVANEALKGPAFYPEAPALLRQRGVA